VPTLSWRAFVKRAKQSQRAFVRTIMSAARITGNFSYRLLATGHLNI